MLDLLLIGLVNMYCGSRAEVVSRQFCFLALSSIFLGCRYIKARSFEFGCGGVVLLLVVQRLVEYYSNVGRQISLSFNIGAWARLL